MRELCAAMAPRVVAGLLIALAAGPLASAQDARSADGRVVVTPAQLTVEPAGQLRLRAYLYRGKAQVFAWPWTFNVAASVGSIDGLTYRAPRAPGRYRLRVGHPDAARQATVWVEVRPASPLARLSLPAGPLRVAPGGQLQLAAKALAADGAELSYRPWWRTSAGSISPDGLLRAPRQAGLIEVKVEGAGQQASVRVEVSAAAGSAPQPALRLVVRAPRERLAAGGRLVLQASLRRGDGPVAIMPWELRWSASRGRVEGNVLIAPATGGPVTVTATHVPSRTRGQLRLVVAGPEPRPALTLALEPASLALHAGASAQLRLRASRGGRPIALPEPGAPPARWSAERGQIDDAGRYRAPRTAGADRVRVAIGEASATLAIRVTAPPAPQTLTLRPRRVTLQPGEALRFSARLGRQAPLRWRAEGGAIDSAGRYRAPDKPGRYRVLAESEGARAEALVIVEAPRPQTLVFRPQRQRLETGELLPLEAWLESDGQRLPRPASEFRFSARRGAVDRARYRAPAEPGEDTVVVRHLPSGRTARAALEIVSAAPTRLTLTPAALELRPGERRRLRIRAHNALGREVSAAGARVELAEGAGKVRDGELIAGETLGRHTLTARLGKLEATAALTVIPHPLERLLLEPAELVLEPGGVASVKLWGVDARGKRRALSGRWAAEGATVSEEGQVRAGQRPGRYTLRAEAAGLRARARLIVLPPLAVAILPAEPRVEAGEAVTLRARLERAGEPIAAPAGDDPAAALIWRLGQRVVGRGPALTMTAPLQPGQLPLRVGLADGPSRTTTLTVTPAQAVRLEIVTPRALPAAGRRTSLLARGLDKRGKPAPVGRVRWSASGGEIDAEGRFLAKQPGRYTIEARAGALLARATLRVLPPLRIVLPAPLTLRVGASHELEPALYQGDSRLWAQPGEFAYRARRGRFEGARYRAPSEPGPDTIEVRFGELAAATLAVTVVAAPAGPARIVLAATTLTLRPGERRRLSARVLDADGRELRVAPSWRCEGASIEGGVLIAGNKPGRYMLVASAGRASAQATLQIRADPELARLGRQWALALRSGAEQPAAFGDALVLKVIYAAPAEVAAFRDSFVASYGADGARLWQQAWHRVLGDFGRYYGRELRRDQRLLAEARTFVRDRISHLTRADRAAFAEAFGQAHGPRGKAVYEQLSR